MITDYQCKGILAKQIAATPDSTGLGTLAKDVDSELPEGSSERLDFLGETAPIREWIGDREPSTPIEYNFAIKNRKFEVTTNFPKAWVKGDKTGNVARSMQGLANRNSQWRSKLVAALLNDGATGNLFRGFDGLPFFATNHAYGVSTINNIVPWSPRMARTSPRCTRSRRSSCRRTSRSSVSPMIAASR